jgi:hypothetical protein
MKFLTLVLICFLLGPDFAAAAQAKAGGCQNDLWELKGDVETEINRYNAFLKTVEKVKDPVPEFNVFLKAHGLPIQMSAEKIKGFPNRLDFKDDELGGPVAVVFLKTMKVPASSGLSFDSVYEFENENSIKELHKWNIPFNESVAAIEGNNLIFQTTLIGVCGGPPEKISLSVQPDGTFQVTDFKKTEGLAGIVVEKCKGTKVAFKDSSYATCRRFEDLKTKKKRILIWQIPLT